MAKVIKFAKTLRENWKKSTFLFGVLAYGSSYGLDRFKTFQMMRSYCEEAKKYGEMPLSQLEKPKHVTVILNPEANNKKANAQFEKFVAPLLHLAGFKVSVFQTEFAKQAIKLMEIMANTDAVIVAGGNGTLQEVVTGLLSRNDDDVRTFPLGVIPLGQTNTVANYLFGTKSSSRAQLMGEATMAVIRNTTVSLDVLKIQFSNEEKPVFALSSFEQGAFSDVQPLVKKYWYFGPFKDRFTYFKNAFKNWSLIENESVEYVAPCEGCSKCFTLHQRSKQEKANRWWHAFVPKTNVKSPEKDYSKVMNEDCGQHLPLKPFYLNVSASTIATDSNHEVKPKTMWIKTYSDSLPFTQFISAGLCHQKSKLKDESEVAQIYKARELIISAPEPSEEEQDEKYTYIDDEKYQRGSCKVSLLPSK